MDYRIEYWKEKETNPIDFLKHFRSTTEPIGGGTELDEEGELVDWDAAVVAVEMAQMGYRWISVEERLPKIDQEVLVMAHMPDNDKLYIPAFWCKRIEDGKFSDGNGFMKIHPVGICVITHWFPVPKFSV